MNQAVLDINDRGYRHPDRLVSTEWVAEHLNDPKVRIIESNEDPLLYPMGHIPGALEVDWTRDLNHPIQRDYLDQPEFESLMGKLGITQDTTVVFYGDRNNWWATYALWVFTLFGHDKAKIMDGGRAKWEREGRTMTRDVSLVQATDYMSRSRDDVTNRAFRDTVLGHVARRGKLIDVRSPQEFSGEKTHMEGYPNEGALRGGHVPGAENVPWAKAVDPETGCFLPAKELQALYEQGAGLKDSDEVIVYCRIGERSSHTWFALKYLLGYGSVRNYDGSWTEYGNLVGAPIERG